MNLAKLAQLPDDIIKVSDIHVFMDTREQKVRNAFSMRYCEIRLNFYVFTLYRPTFVYQCNRTVLLSFNAI